MVMPYSAALQTAAAETRDFTYLAAEAGQQAEEAFAQAARGTLTYSEAAAVATQATRAQAQSAVAAGVQQVESLQLLKAEHELQALKAAGMGEAHALKAAEREANQLARAMTNLGRTGAVGANVAPSVLRRIREEVTLV